MFKRTNVLLLAGLVLSATGSVTAQTATSYQPVEQYIGDMNPLSKSLRRLHMGIARPMGFQDVFEVPGEPGKLMRVHGSVHAVFSQSLYAINDDEEMEAVIPPNTVFRIGPRAAPGSLGMAAVPSIPGLPGQGGQLAGRGGAFRVLPEGFGPAAAPRQELQRSVTASAPAAPMVLAMRAERDAGESTEAAASRGTIIDDENVRRDRLRFLLKKAAAAE